MAPPFSFPYKYLLPSLLLHSPPEQSSLVRESRHSKQGRGRKLPILGTCRLQVCRRSSRDNSDRGTGRMSRGSRGLDLKLHLSPPPAPAPARGGGGERAASLSSSDEEWSSSSPSSCLSSEGEREPPPRHHQGQQGHGLQWSDSPEATAMVLAACPRCLMYVMLSEADPRCPRCRSPVLLDFLHHAAGNASGGGGGGRDDDSHSRNSTRGGGGRRNRRA